LIVAAALAALAIPAAAQAQGADNLSGTYRCVQGCAPGFEGRVASVTQNGRDLAIVSESGVPIRAWLDWYAPASRIWMDSLNQSAVYSPDFMTIQFDRGTVWARTANPETVAVAYCARRYRSYDPVSQTFVARDGIRHPCP
jgi:BA14K-like protein